jgi:triosephosphate isomerase (TIM)
LRKPFIAGNWKMNTTLEEAIALATEVRRLTSRVRDVEVAVLPPFPYLYPVGRKLEDSGIALGAQDVYTASTGDEAPVHFGAYTGQISALMLKSVGCTYVCVGHSERRQLFGDTDPLVGRKVRAALDGGLKPILCVGERLDEREGGQTLPRVETQLREGLRQVRREEAETIVVAYEPVWAIGTGKVATNAQAQEVHAFIRRKLAERFDPTAADAIRIQYGGSVKAENAAGLMAQPDVDGALVGGASLKAESFAGIVRFKEHG